MPWWIKLAAYPPRQKIPIEPVGERPKPWPMRSRSDSRRCEPTASRDSRRGGSKDSRRASASDEASRPSAWISFSRSSSSSRSSAISARELSSSLATC